MSAIFLDRDGVIIRKAPEGEYITDWREVEFLPGALDAIGDLFQAGFKIIIVTNQRGVATGKIEISKLDEIHSGIKHAVASHGAKIAATYCCTHDTSEQCSCRKPNPGMLLQAAAEHNVDLLHCWMVGDSATDIDAGRRAHCKTAFIADSEQRYRWAEKPDICATSLAAVAKLILRLEDQKGSRAVDRKNATGANGSKHS